MSAETESDPSMGSTFAESRRFEIVKPHVGKAIAKRIGGRIIDINIFRTDKLSGRAASPAQCPGLLGDGRAARVQMVVIDGHLAHSSRERDRQLAGRDHVAEEGVDDGRSAHRSRMPRVGIARGSLLREPAKGQRPPGRDDGDHRLLCPGDLGGKLFLGTGQAEKGARPAPPERPASSPTKRTTASANRAASRAAAKPS